MRSIILASASPRRQEYLALLGYPYTCKAADVDESSVQEKDPARLAMAEAQLKARAVAAGERNAIVIGADTVVAVDGAILGKPRDAADVRRMLSLLSGRAHQVYTGLCLIDAESGAETLDCRETTVRMQSISQGEIESYVATGEPMDKAGAYAIQGGASRFVESIEGCYFNVLGLPINLLYNLLTPMLRAGDSHGKM
jgi:septum formation protein